MMLYAKSRPQERLCSHTKQLINLFYNLKSAYPNILESKEWDMLLIAVTYHDAGKVFTPFQNEIRKKLDEEQIVTTNNLKYQDVYHNFLSPAFLPNKLMKSLFEKDEISIIKAAIMFHHFREIDEKKVENYLHVLIENSNQYIQGLNEEFYELRDVLGNSILEKNSLFKSMTVDYRVPIKLDWDDDEHIKFIKISGILKRLDHTASANIVNIESGYNENLSNYVLKKIPTDRLRPLQKDVINYRNDNLIIVAPTGAGKTEGAFLWMDCDKAFFTLPVRVSINALYLRLNEVYGYQEGGLLHSSNKPALEQMKDKSDLNIYNEEAVHTIISESQLLNKKVTFTTIDQIFKIPFLYKGYDKVLATLSYSKVVVDELQAYEPEIVAAIIKGLEMISEVGGKFMIMTATLPPIYTNLLRKRNHVDFILRDEYPKKVVTTRHKVDLLDCNISDENIIDKITQESQIKKVLVIVNTIKKAQELYGHLKLQGISPKMLHSNFIRRDRDPLERQIKSFTDEGNIEPGVWITTQIVEASLDIDFDMLFSELSSIDSIIQRLGRCNRKGRFDYAMEQKAECNVIICCRQASGVGIVYDKFICQLTLQYLLDFKECPLTENDKVMLVNKVYSEENMKDSEFYILICNSLKLLDEKVKEHEMDSKKAQMALRRIDKVSVMPLKVYESDEVQEILIEYKKNNLKFNKDFYNRIEAYTLSIYSTFFEKNSRSIKDIPDLAILPNACMYDAEIGLTFVTKDEDEQFI